MNKQKLIFIISSIVLLIVDIAFGVFCAISLSKVFNNYAILTSTHFSMFLITLSLNIVYFLYIIITLIYNRIKS